MKTKPAPDIFEAAMRNLGNTLKNSDIVIGDTPHDAVAARRAGLSVAGVLCGGFSEPYIKKRQRVPQLQDIVDILANLPALLKHRYRFLYRKQSTVWSFTIPRLA